MSELINRWYCVECQRYVDPIAVTYEEAHVVCGRIITHDKPPTESRETGMKDKDFCKRLAINGIGIKATMNLFETDGVESGTGLASPQQRIVSHQSQLPPGANKFHKGNGGDGKHYWLTPPDLYAELDAEFRFDFDPCPFPKPPEFDGLTCEWGQSNYVNPPFGSIMHQGPNDKNPKKKGPTAWMRKAIAEAEKGKGVLIVYPVDKWVLMMMEATGARNIRNLGDVRWCATEDLSQGKGTGRHIAAFILGYE